MKSPLYLILFILVIGSSAYGQDEADWPVKGDSEIGIILGLNVAQVYGSDIESDLVDYSSGLLLGVSYDYYFSSKWSLKAILNYDQKGFEALGLVDTNFDYLTIPINANWHFGKRKRWYLNFGPYIGFLLAADVEGDDIKDQLESTDLGFNTGIGVKIPIGDNLMFFIESSGQTGFTSVDSDVSIKNQRGNLAFGVFF